MEDTDESDDSVQPVDVSKKVPTIQRPYSPASPSLQRSTRSSSRATWRGRLMNQEEGPSCPTCRGTGRLPRGASDELVALIPFSDKRLKPRRWRVCVAVSVVCLLVFVVLSGAVLLGFMFPRSASLSLVSMNSSTQWTPLDNSTTIVIFMITHLHIRNDNFFPLQVDWLNVTLYNVNTKVGENQSSSFSVDARQNTMAEIEQNATFLDTLGQRVKTLCTGEHWEHCLAMFAVAEMSYSVLSHKSQALASKNFFVNCDSIQSSPFFSSACSN